VGVGSSTGSATPTGVSVGGDYGGRMRHDADGDADIDLLDFANLQACAGHVNADPSLGCIGVHDRDASGVSDGQLSAADGAGLVGCMNGPGVAVPTSCVPPTGAPTRPKTGDFGLHGRTIEVLADGKVLIYWRARWYDPEHARWLTRDPLGYVDGGNLYEAFGGNGQLFGDPDRLDRLVAQPSLSKPCVPDPTVATAFHPCL